MENGLSFESPCFIKKKKETNTFMHLMEEYLGNGDRKKKTAHCLRERRRGN